MKLFIPSKCANSLKLSITYLIITDCWLGSVMTSSEDVLLQVGPVRHKKGDGTLYVMSQHIAFILNSSDTVAISHHYRDIKMQKISSEFKNKVQLQLVFHDETISLFQFTNPER